MSLIEFELTSVTDPYPLLASLRSAGPVHRIAMPDGALVWLITGYSEVRAALADPRFSLSKQNARGSYRGFALPPALDANLLNMDPPDHTRLRRFISTAFTPRRTESLGEQIESVAGRLLNALALGESADLIASFAAPLPIAIICKLLGVPEHDRYDFRSWTNALVMSEVTDRSQSTEEARKEAVVDILHFIKGLINDKRAEPADDLVSALIAGRDADDRLSENELVSLVFLIFFAGYENSVTLIGNGVLSLLLHPDQLTAVRNEPHLLASAVEEMLRYDGPASTAIRRFSVEDVKIGDVTIPAGDTVLLSLASANRDRETFTDPDRFDVHRRENPHVSFGHGIHYCLGAYLARMEAQIAINTLFRRFPNLALAVPENELCWRPSLRTHSLRSLPVRL